MTKKRCTDCKYTKGIGYDFWCGEGHTEYEVFGAETNCPYYEYHDWSKGTPMTENKRFELTMRGNEVAQYEIIDRNQEILTVYNNLGNVYFSSAMKICELLNNLAEENEQLKSTIKEVTELLVEEVDVFSEKATEHDINAYLELKELDNKDAFYMAIATKEAIKMLKEMK